MDYPNSIPDLQHKTNLKKLILERLENDLMEAQKRAQEATFKHEQTMSHYLKAQADFLQISAKLNEAQAAKAEFDETFKSAIDRCVKKELNQNTYSAD
jgi:cytoskeletal protein RodZ